MAVQIALAQKFADVDVEKGNSLTERIEAICQNFSERAGWAGIHGIKADVSSSQADVRVKIEKPGSESLIFDIKKENGRFDVLYKRDSTANGYDGGQEVFTGADDVVRTFKSLLTHKTLTSQEHEEFLTARSRPSVGLHAA